MPVEICIIIVILSTPLLESSFTSLPETAGVVLHLANSHTRLSWFLNGLRETDPSLLVLSTLGKRATRSTSVDKRVFCSFVHSRVYLLCILKRGTMVHFMMNEERIITGVSSFKRTG